METERMREPDSTPLCPSVPPEWEGSFAFGVVGGTVPNPRLRYLDEPLPVTEELLARTQPVRPTEVLRFAAPCAGGSCSHFVGNRCSLVDRVVQILPAVTETLPPCILRPACRWWQQDGKSACQRCPQIVTDNIFAPEAIVRVTSPPRRESAGP